MKSNKILILTSTILTLFLIEVFCSFFLFKKSEYNYKNRYLVYSEGNVFRNIDNFFTYEPNTSITASNFLTNHTSTKCYCTASHSQLTTPFATWSK